MAEQRQGRDRPAPANGGHSGDGERRHSSSSLKGEPPDVRFTYANERTFLAWNRTALALIATGVAATQLLPEFSVTGGRRLLGLPLIGLGAVVAFESFHHWRANERAMWRGEPLPRSVMPIVVTAGIVVVGVLAVVLASVS